jgi:hypothetical protein
VADEGVKAPLLLLLAACSPAPEPVRVPTTTVVEAHPEVFPREEDRWPKFHSVRFRLSVPLPDGKAWKIDDHTRPELTATHDASKSALTLVGWNENELVNRAKCEDRARAKGYVAEGEMQTVEDAPTIGPESYDTRIWVAVKPGKDAAQPVAGHVFAFGAYVRTCLFVHFRTEVPAGRDEEVLSGRLALAKVRLVGGIALDPPRTTPDSTPPTRPERGPH